MKNPLYKIGDVVIYRGFLGFIQQGIVRAATWMPTNNWVQDGEYQWKYYVSSRPNSWIVRGKDIIAKA